MTNFFSKFKIPTLLGLGIIIFGLIAGLYLVLREQIFLSQAAPSVVPEKENIIVSNISEDSVTISWVTSSAASSFITYGLQNPKEQTVLDDRDTGKPTARLTHYVTIKNLSGQANYQYIIVSSNSASDILKFNTSKALENQTQLNPVIGKVVQNDNNPVNDGIAYLSITETIILSAPVKNEGNFLIPLSKIQIANIPEVAKLTIIGDQGEATALIRLSASSQPLPLIKLGQNVDLATIEPSVQPIPTANDLDQYDLNNDRIINANDHAIVSSCIGKKLSSALPEGVPCSKADINNDGKIDENDLDLISQKINELGL